MIQEILKSVFNGNFMDVFYISQDILQARGCVEGYNSAIISFYVSWHFDEFKIFSFVLLQHL